jgi:DNA-directed RNA polymerase delta subunit
MEAVSPSELNHICNMFTNLANRTNRIRQETMTAIDLISKNAIAEVEESFKSRKRKRIIQDNDSSEDEVSTDSPLYKYIAKGFDDVCTEYKCLKTEDDFKGLRHSESNRIKTTNKRNADLDEEYNVLREKEKPFVNE